MNYQSNGYEVELRECGDVKNISDLNYFRTYFV